MTIFRVSLEGSNLLVKIDDKWLRVGFFVDRFIEAESESMASSLALSRAYEDVAQAGFVMEGTSPDIMVENVRVVASMPKQQPGFAFFKE
jgi:hypothetical protein